MTVFSCQDAKDQKAKQLPRIAIAGLAIESSTFSPALTHEEAFHSKIGTDIFSIYPFFRDDSTTLKRATWFPTLKGHALPGGRVTREAYESLVKKNLRIIEKGLALRWRVFRYSWHYECRRYGRS